MPVQILADQIEITIAGNSIRTGVSLVLDVNSSIIVIIATGMGMVLGTALGRTKTEKTRTGDMTSMTKIDGMVVETPAQNLAKQNNQRIDAVSVIFAKSS